MFGKCNYHTINLKRTFQGLFSDVVRIARFDYASYRGLLTIEIDSQTTTKDWTTLVNLNNSLEGIMYIQVSFTP
jgi:hypothetical protein